MPRPAMNNPQMNNVRNVLVLGLGKSGMAAARLLRRRGLSVSIADSGVSPELRQRAAEFTTLGCDVKLGGDALSGNFDQCVVSPGFASNNSILSDLRKREIPIIAEFELGWSCLSSRVLAVTGSNGKSTLAKLCAEAITHAGLKVCLGGNYGVPLCRIVDEGFDWDWVILEVSSFQLETARIFRPDIGILLNLHPNHLDRHGNFVTYRDLKFRLFENMGKGDTAIIAADTARQFPDLGDQARRLTFGDDFSSDYQYRPGAIYLVDGAEVAAVNLCGTVFDNPVLGLSVAAAAAAMRAGGVDMIHLESAARKFERLPHRLEDIGTVGGVRFVNDSKATNVAALLAALQTMERPIRLIAGGQGKGESFAPVAELLAEKVAVVYLFGRDAEVMAAAWRDHVSCRLCSSLSDACAVAWREARPGDTILLSPACASFDQFKDFTERGECFRTFFSFD